MSLVSDQGVCNNLQVVFIGSFTCFGHEPAERPSVGKRRQGPLSMQKVKELVSMNILDKVDAAYLRDDIPEFRAGDTVEVDVKIVEGKTERIQVFKGVVIRRQGGGVRETFTVRKVSFGIAVERTFPVHSPNIDEIRVVFKGDVRRAKLYYLRNLRGKAARIKERR